MESSISGTVSLHEKLMSSTTFLVVLGVVLYTDIYLTMVFEENIFSVSLSWYQEHFQLKHITTYVVSFSLLYGIILPVLISILDNFIFVHSKTREVYCNEILVSTLKSDAIVENNSVVFKLYENSLKKINNENHVRKLMLGIVLMSIIGLIYWAPLNGSKPDNFAGFVISALGGDQFFSGVYKLLLLSIAIWFLFSLKAPSSEFNTYEYIENYESRHEMIWIREFESGLIDKAELSKHVHCICSRVEGTWFHMEKYDYSNSSHRYCETHKLIKNEKGNVKPTTKGLFFKDFIK